MKDIYDLQSRLNRVLRSIQLSKEIPPANKEILLKFHDELIARSLSTARVLFYMNKLWNVARWIKLVLKKIIIDNNDFLIISFEKYLLIPIYPLFTHIYHAF